MGQLDQGLPAAVGFDDLDIGRADAFGRVRDGGQLAQRIGMLGVSFACVFTVHPCAGHGRCAVTGAEATGCNPRLFSGALVFVVTLHGNSHAPMERTARVNPMAN